MYINPEVVESELKSIDDIVAELEKLVNLTESDISKGYDSERAREISTKIDKTKENISTIKNCLTKVRQRAGKVAETISAIDQG